MAFPRQEYWNELHFLLQGIFLTQGLNPCLPHWQADSLPLSHLRSLIQCTQTLKQEWKRKMYLRLADLLLYLEGLEEDNRKGKPSLD